MIQKLLSALFILATFFSFIPTLAASPPVIIDGSNDSGSNLLFGQRHNYTLVFRNDGKATVLGRIVFKNTDKEPVKEIQVTVPNVTASDTIFYQIIAPRRCIEYGGEIGDDLGSRPCKRYDDDYLYQSSSYGGNEEYRKLNVSLSDAVFTITLAEPVEENRAGGVVFAFRAKGYAKRTPFGAYRFTFTSPTVVSPIDLVRVAVDVDSDLYLKGKRSKVAYHEDITAVNDAAPQSLSAPTIGRSMSYYEQRGFIKEGKNLGSGESLVVKGSFADSWWKLYALEILATVAGIVLLILIIRVWRRRHPHIATAGSPPHFVYSLKNFGLAFAAALTAFGLTYLLRLFTGLFDQYGGDLISILVLAIVMIGLYAALLFGPPVMVALSMASVDKSRAWQSFFFIFFTELLLLAIFLVIYTSFAQNFPDGSPPYYSF